MRSRPLPSVLSTAVLAGVLGLSLVACADAPEPEEQTSASDPAPASVESCGHTTTVTSTPRRAVTLNQGATEVMLALGLEESMVGTAYLDEAIAPQWQAAYDAVPVLSPEYPTHEEFLAAGPDFAYASYVSAFDPKVAGSQEELDDLGIATYLSPFGCAETADRPDLSWEAVWDEIDAIGTLFGVSETAEEVVTEQRATLDELAEEAPGDGLTALWYDSGSKAPLVGVGNSGPQLVLDAIGLENIFAGVSGGWEEVSWEEVVAADPDVIVLSDAAWDSATSKQRFLEKDPVLSKLSAVENGRFLSVSYAEGTPGVRMVDGASTLAEQIEALDLS